MQARNSTPLHAPKEPSIREQLTAEIEHTPDRILPILLEFLLFLKSRSSLGKQSPPSTGASILAALEKIGPWEGDDFEECLELVHRSRSRVYLTDDDWEDETSVESWYSPVIEM